MISFFDPFLYLGILTSVVSFMTLCLQRKHLLNALLCLEILMVGIFILLIFLCNMLSNEGLVIFIFLTLTASGASVGLALLVILIRCHGNDYVSSCSLHKC
uniref:NADH-ubiquinone oxidoreductase chain 4L n=1 Tax=Cyanoplax caverna TaxID=1503210 RepID=A0A0E3DE01_9MOLL|nr:NADH dehydrogenase subunit 4L [Cyanoplax caverna]AIA77058.1 NADH dehydrogenase subunit 4L [Cyanoplax caverna]